jgi:hypothetical protein
MNYILNCKHCGQEFNGKRSTATYCSDSCRVRACQVRNESESALHENANDVVDSNFHIDSANEELPQMHFEPKALPTGVEQLNEENIAEPIIQKNKDDNLGLAVKKPQYRNQAVQPTNDENENENSFNWLGLLGTAAGIGLAIYWDKRTRTKPPQG